MKFAQENNRKIRLNDQLSRVQAGGGGEGILTGNPPSRIVRPMGAEGSPGWFSWAQQSLPSSASSLNLKTPQGECIIHPPREPACHSASHGAASGQVLCTRAKVWAPLPAGRPRAATVPAGMHCHGARSLCDLPSNPQGHRNSRDQAGAFRPHTSSGNCTWPSAVVVANPHWLGSFRHQKHAGF